MSYLYFPKLVSFVYVHVTIKLLLYVYFRSGRNLFEEEYHSVFKEKIFLQIHGTAMGPKNVCSYADLAMGEVDFQAKFSGSIKPALWWRYLNDVFDFWHRVFLYCRSLLNL